MLSIRIFLFIFDEMLLFFCVFGFHHCTTMSKTELMTAIMHSKNGFSLRFLVPIAIFGVDSFIFGYRSAGNHFQEINSSISWAVEWSKVEISIEKWWNKWNLKFRIWYWNRNYSNSQTCEIWSKIINLYTTRRNENTHFVDLTI